MDGLKQHSPTTIANSFSKFYSQMGTNLARKIQPSKIFVDRYISKIPHTVNSLLVNVTSRTKIEKTVMELPNKTSCGHNQISNNLLKSLGKSISYPLEIIFNQSLMHGEFPDLMKIAEIIPLF